MAFLPIRRSCPNPDTEHGSEGLGKVSRPDPSNPTRQVRPAFLPAVVVVALVTATCASASDSPATAATEAPTVTSAAAPATTTATAPVTTTGAPTTTTAPVTTTEAPPTTEAGAPTTTPASTTTTTAPEPEPDLPVIEGLSPEISAQVWEAVEVTEGIRGLEFEDLPVITVLSPEDFEARVRMEVDSDLEDVEVDEALYKLLGLLEPDDDLRALYGELYGESVAGFYSSEDKELVIPASGEEFTGLQTMTLVHELIHALTDQHFDFGSRMEDLLENQMHDPASGLVGLVEGDATLAEFVYVNNLDSAARSRLAAEFADYEPPDIDIPQFMELALYFPYDAGFEYVLNRWREGGWSAVNDQYLDPPGSTEEIYEGAPSPTTEVIEMERPAGVLPEGYEEIYDYTWGFLNILVMFEQILGREVAVDAATGWGGGRSLVGYAEDGEVVLVWEYAGDDPAEVEELARLLADYAAAGMRVGEPQTQGEFGFLASADDYVLVAPIPAGLVMVACSDPEACPSVSTAYLP